MIDIARAHLRQTVEDLIQAEIKAEHYNNMGAMQQGEATLAIARAQYELALYRLEEACKKPR